MSEALLTVTRREAAIRQIDAAIDAYQQGDFDISITLAGAAEGMFSHRRAKDLFTMMMSDPRSTDFGKKSLNSIINKERDWLKHGPDGRPDTITIGAYEAAHMLVRAMTKHEVWSVKMEAVKDEVAAILLHQTR